MKSVIKNILVLAVSTLVTVSVSAQTIAQWTFETSVPTTAGPYSPEVGSGSALGSHAGASVYSNPSGNGSVESFSSTNWAIGDYYQFQVSTIGYAGIGLSFDQTSSSTGPRNFDLTYGTDGVNFTVFSSYAVLQNGGAPNPSWTSGSASSAYSFLFDMSSITALDNAATVYFRLVDSSTTSASGGTVAPGGTDRVDNVTVFVVPEPSSLVLFGLTGVAALGLLRRRA